MRNAGLILASALLAAVLTLAAYQFLVGGRESDRLHGEIAALTHEQQQMRKMLDESHEVLAAANDQTALLLREGLQAAAAIRIAIVEYYQTNGKMPARQSDAGLPAPDRYRGKTLKSAIVLPDGSIELVFDAASGMDGGIIRLVADTSHADAMGIQWRCETSDYPQIKRVSAACEYKPRTGAASIAPAHS